MSTTTRCDQCEKTIANPSNQITVTNLCTPSGIMMARDFDFCGPDCFWAWTRKWPVPRGEPTEPSPGLQCGLCQRRSLHEAPIVIGEHTHKGLVCDHCGSTYCLT